MRDNPELLVEIRRGDQKIRYSEELNPNAILPSIDLGEGPFRVPNRHNLRIHLDRAREFFETNTHRQMFKEWGSSFGCTYGPRKFRASQFSEWHDDEGDALLNALVPMTGAETFIEATAAAQKIVERHHDPNT